MTGVVGAVLEAWDELRVHKVRVLLALVGVAVAVCAITAISAAGEMLRQVSAEQNDRWNGRAATLQVSAWPTGEGGSVMPAPEEYERVFDEVVERYAIGYSSMLRDAPAPVRFPDGTREVYTTGVEADWATMHRFEVTSGRWFTDADADRLAPALVVNQAFLDALGGVTVAEHPTVTIGGDNPVVATVVGAFPDDWPQAEPQAYVLVDAQSAWVTPESLEMTGPPRLELWVPDDLADGLVEAIQRDVAGALGGTQADVFRSDSAGYAVVDGAIRWVVLGVSVIALLLGGLGLVNIALVTVRYRIREIGIRRSFGASSGRVFFSVMMESVVATTVAGVLGVTVAVVALHNVPLDALMGSAVQDAPGFPFSAAVTGMLAAVGIGALAGLLPALVAVRVKVIDAIRY
ncbi:ABC transporter permease [Cellulosimicrobium cellulans]|uniref:Macrolide ABC transporter permease n=1 Tax=Cellulosimicrobium cellulans TaxID=1710 RepID=A0A4Y4E5Q3_CELCE|nr:ABC transporter permease [Cellulosimicrobium cellulans]GED11265.1 macrolide ABC transporter permease [Cellulosimicrobium cellulans]